MSLFGSRVCSADSSMYFRKDNAAQGSIYFINNPVLPKMLSKARISVIRSLQQKKNRQESQAFIAEGSKLVLELLASSFNVEAVYATVDWLQRYGGKTGSAGESVAVTAEELGRISALSTASDVLAVVKIPARQNQLSGLNNRFVLALDGIRDPGNMGTIIRIADWFGIEDIICSPDSAEIWNPKVVQASMGSIIRVNVHEQELASFFSSLPKDVPVYGAFLNGSDIYKTRFAPGGVLVIGNESSGIRPETEKFITEKITIPSFALNGSGAESLNAAVATAIVCSEIRRNPGSK